MSQITVELSEQGVERVTIHADDAGQQRAAHELLGVVSGEMRALDLALKAYRPAKPKEPAYSVRVGNMLVSGQDRITKGPVLHLSPGAALTFTKPVAMQLLDLLRSAGHVAVLVENKFVDPCEAVDELEMVWKA